MSKSQLDKVKRYWRDCNDCGLGAKAHTHVFYRGSCPCEVLFIGEGPGKDEDKVGEPFVGRAGDILNALLKESQGELVSRGWDSQTTLEGAYTFGITNIIVCRATDSEGKDRPPTKDEATACSSRLRDTIEAANPRLIILLGRSAEKWYKMAAPLVSVPIFPLEHPSYINRNGGIGSAMFQSCLTRLVEVLEKHLYGSQEAEGQPPKKALKVRRIKQKGS